MRINPLGLLSERRLDFKNEGIERGFVLESPIVRCTILDKIPHMVLIAEIDGFGAVEGAAIGAKDEDFATALAWRVIPHEVNGHGQLLCPVDGMDMVCMLVLVVAGRHGKTLSR